MFVVITGFMIARLLLARFVVLEYAYNDISLRGLSGRLVATEPYIYEYVTPLRPSLRDLNEYDDFDDALENVEAIIVESYRADSSYKIENRKIGQIEYNVLTTNPEIRNTLNKHILEINELKSKEIVDLKEKYDIFHESKLESMNGFLDFLPIWYMLLGVVLMSAIAYIIKLIYMRI